MALNLKMAGLGGLFGGLKRPSGLVPYRSVLTASDLGITADVSLTANKWVAIGSYTVSAQTGLKFGYGRPNTRETATIYIRLVSTSGATTYINGQIRVIHANSEETKKTVVWQELLENLRGDTDDKNKKIFTPETEFWMLREDDKLIVEVKVTSADTLDYDATNLDIRIPVTKYA